MIRPLFSLVLAAALLATPALSRPRSQPDANTADTEKAEKPVRGKGRTTREPAAAETESGKGRGSARGKGTEDKKGNATEDKSKAANAKGGKPVQVGTYGNWGVYTAGGKSKTCYALAQPKDRAPASIKKDGAYLFISNRPAESVRNEISIIMGFPMKDNADAKAEIGSAHFDLICKGTNAWVKNPAKEGDFIEALKKGSRLVIKASSAKGALATDTYALAGISDALARVHKDCP